MSPAEDGVYLQEVQELLLRQAPCPLDRQKLPHICPRHDGRHSRSGTRQAEFPRPLCRTAPFHRGVRGSQEEECRLCLALTDTHMKIITPVHTQMQRFSIPTALLGAWQGGCKYPQNPASIVLPFCSRVNQGNTLKILDSRACGPSNTAHLRGQKAGVDALAKQLAHDGVLAHQPRGVPGRGGRRRRKRRLPERGDVRPELRQRLRNALLMQQQRHHLFKAQP